MRCMLKLEKEQGNEWYMYAQWEKNVVEGAAQASKIQNLKDIFWFIGSNLT